MTLTCENPGSCACEPERSGAQDAGSLDPRNWEAFRHLSHRALDRMIDFHRDFRARPVWKQMPEDVADRFREGPPAHGIGLAAVLQDFESLVLPYPLGNFHPRFWGWAVGSGSPTGMLAAALAAGLNPVAGVFDDSASRVEAQVLSWMKEIFRFPPDASGILTSGGSVANLVGLAAAREARLGTDQVRKGLAGAPPATLYASSEVHASVLKAAKLMGLGEDGVRLVPVDARFRIQLPRLRERLRQDRDDERCPFAVVGTAGTINTAAIDPLEDLADLAAEEKLWFHVDGAFGAAAALSPATRGLVAGMERADSLAFDFHKWMHVPYEAGCVLVRDRVAHRNAFSVGAEYLRPLDRGPSRQPDSSNLKGPQLSRGFNALKVWFTLKEHGVEQFGRLISRNVEQARYLGDLVDASPFFVRAAPVSLNVVAFRHEPRELDGDEADVLNRELLMRIQEGGVAVPSGTIVHGRFTLRVCVCNHRTSTRDLEMFFEEAERTVREVRRDMGLPDER